MTKPEWPVIPDGAEYDLIWSGDIYFIPAEAYLKVWDTIEHVATVYEDNWDGYRGPMTHDDDALAKLRETYPGWRIWLVPATGGNGGTWCAQPRPTINVGSPDELIRAIEAARPGEPDSPSIVFDPEGDTPVRVRGSQGF